MTLSKKIDFAVVFKVRHANPNGDPLNGNRPRTTYDGIGEMEAGQGQDLEGKVGGGASESRESGSDSAEDAEAVWERDHADSEAARC